MIQRTLSKSLQAAAAHYPVVTVTGPRQSGKTTLVRAVFRGDDYVSLEDPEQRAFALDDPHGFLGQFDGRVVLDEAQRTPELFSYIQVLVDEEDRPGRFILTGSQNFLLLRTLSQTLAGRCAVLHLLPLSLDEQQGHSPRRVGDVGHTIPKSRGAPETSLAEVLVTGGYPRVHDQGLDPQEWLRNYLQTYLERDVRDLLQVGDLEAFRRFVALCAGRTGQLLNLSGLAADSGISHSTARRWLSVLETSFLVIRLPPHHRNFNKRLVKSPKLYFLDTGLLCYLLRVRSPDELRVHPFRGPIFESFVVSELYKRACHAGEEPDLFFWRDATGHEVDLLIVRGSQVVPAEIKAGETVAADFFKGLDYWRHLAGEPEGTAALIYGGDRSYRRRGVAVYPWWAF
jgi:hypothetical protein